MKTLDFNEMENVNGGNDLMPCGQALFWGAWVGGVILGGVGAFIGAVSVAVGPNCKHQ